MKVLICGAGKVTRHLLARLGERWQVTLIDKSEDKLQDLITKFENVQKVITADGSSPVTLDDAGLADFDYVLALTENDKVNLAICEYAGSQEVSHLLALVNEEENKERFQEIGARPVLGSTLSAKSIHHYLQDPRINLMSLSLGQAEIMEMDVSDHFQVIGKGASSLTGEDWRLVAILRQNLMFFPKPETVIEMGDRLVIVGQPDSFKTLCMYLECGVPHFPLGYGPDLLLALLPESNHEELIKETMHLAQNTKVKSLTALCSKEDGDIEQAFGTWTQTTDIKMVTVKNEVEDSLEEIGSQENYGVMVVPPFEASFFVSLAKPTLISLAHSISCPLLVARQSHPYERILVPFNATSKAELALGVAVDLARQFGAEVAVAVVEEPEFIRGVEEEKWTETVLKRVRELAHIYKFEFEVIIKKGNPVKEVVALAQDFNLMVMGSTTREKGLFSPHVGEHMAQDVPCSVLIIAK
ncbi:MAG: NAD-binding protein [Deltaproteobacteria bacterium]|nr:NAD-binding protein [Deltaproteobacteria bacterium]